MSFTIEVEKETDGRWIAEVLEVPGALAYGETHREAINQVLSILEDLGDEVIVPSTGVKAEVTLVPSNEEIKTKRLLELLHTPPNDDKSPAWWDEFEEELRQNRLNFPERDLGIA